MAKKNNYQNNKKNNKNVKPKKYNPAGTIWGKIIIFVLAIAMGLAGLISLIYLIIQNMFY